MKSAFIVLLLFSVMSGSVSMANDGFYQGSGTTLVPIENDHMRVIQEMLEITSLSEAQCYSVLYKRKSLLTRKTVPSGVRGKIGPMVACGEEPNKSRPFIAKFHAKAVYQVESLVDQDQVQMGFPVPFWEYEFMAGDNLEDLAVPGVVHFETSVDGQKVGSVTLKKITSASLAKIAHPYGKMNFAYTWILRFKKKTRYTLAAEYDFGSVESNAFYSGREILDGQELWFDQRPKTGVDRDMGPSAESVLYYLSPLQLWHAAPPEVVRVRFQTPPGIPITYLISTTPGLKCIDNGALYFEWTNSYPTQELSVSYPKLSTLNKMKQYQPMTQNREFETWLLAMSKLSESAKTSSYANRLSLACDLTETLLKTLGKRSTLQEWQNKTRSLLSLNFL